jgi:hypothetical protein
VNSGAPEKWAVPAPLASVHTFHGVMLQDCSCPAHVDVGGDMPVMSMVDNIYMHIRSLKRETQQVLHDCYVAQEKPMPVSKLTCEKFPVVRRGMKVQIQQVYFEL